MSKPTLYGHPVSIYVRKARLALLFSGVEFEHEALTPHAEHAEFRAASPLGKIPAFRDEHIRCADSSVIAHYLNRFYPDAGLIPDDRDGFAQTIWYDEYADSMMAPVVGNHLFAEVVLAGRLFPRAPIQADIDKAVNEELPVIYAFLNERLQGRQWLVADQPNLADIAVGGMMMAVYHCGQQVPESAPALRAWVERFFALPMVRDVLQDEAAMLAQMQYSSPVAG